MLNIKKTYYSISEVCGLTGLEPHVLRYWETEFSQLRPKKNRAGNRAYREKDIEIVNYIKHLLYDEKYTIPGAKKRLSEVKSTDPEQIKLDLPVDPPKSDPDIIAEVKKELNLIYKILNG
jgi:DNA-binding transcriptional MerR regulator